jgi:hypothetical protein
MPIYEWRVLVVKTSISHFNTIRFKKASLRLTIRKILSRNTEYLWPPIILFMILKISKIVQCAKEIAYEKKIGPRNFHNYKYFVTLIEIIIQPSK